MSTDLLSISEHVSESAPLRARSSVPPRPAGPVATGHVVEDFSGLPVAGLVVQWVARDHREGRPARQPERTTVLGVGITQEDGHFEIASTPTPDAGEAMCGLEWRTDLSSHFRFEGEDGPVDLPADTANGDTLIRLASHAAPRAEQWRALGEYLSSQRRVRVDELLHELSAPPRDSPAQAWSAALRAGALGQAAQALATAEGAAPADLFDMPHLLNLEALASGDLVKAVTNFRDIETFEHYGGAASVWFDHTYFHFPRSDLALYRDYLRDAWVSAARLMHASKSAPPPTDAALAAQLVTRFHQNFYTGDATPQPSHPLLIKLLREVLIAPADKDGFGFTSATLPMRPADASDADYVAALIAHTGKSAHELLNRFRVRFERPLDDLSSPVALNVEALLGLLADTYQSPQEPFPTALRGIEDPRPLIFPDFLGRAPFFLEYEEWLDRQRRFYPENVYDIRRSLPLFGKGYRDVIAAQKTAGHTKVSPYNDYMQGEGDWHASAAWMERIFAITDSIRASMAAADKQAYAEAQGDLDAALGAIDAARQAAPSRWTVNDFIWYDENGNLPTPATLKLDRHVSLQTRSVRPVTSAEELAAFEAYFDARPEPRVAAYEGGPQPGFYDWMESWLSRARTLYVHELDYLEWVLVPYLRAMVLQATGDLAGATRLLGRITGFEVGVAQVTDTGGYLPSLFGSPYFHQHDALPYTTAVAFDADGREYADQRPQTGWWEGARSPLAPPLMAPFEQRFFKLAQAEAMLSWADELYRNDDTSSIRRARELFKGVMFLHGADPDIAPHFPVPGANPFIGHGHGVGLELNGDALVSSQANPARSSQLARAQAGFGQIELGLNAYGFRDDMVPVLRYKPLKLAADTFAASAKSAQSDFLQYQTRFEQATIEGWQTAAMVQKAQAGAGIAAEQVEIAKFDVAKAQQQVAAVKAQIDAKRKEIEDADSFFGQAEAFFGGMKDSLSGLASAGKGVMSDDSAAGAVSSEQLIGMLGKSSGGAAAGKEAMAATLGSGAAMTMGFAAFAYYGYITMDGMADAHAKRSGDLASLQNVALPAAQALVTLKQRDVTIAHYAQQIAATELDLARALDRFQRERFLNVDVWNKLSAFAQRTMKRYVDLGARAAWLAERALAYESNRVLDVVRLNYVPNAMRGLTGADRLLLDLAELEAQRLGGIRLTVPVKHTLSLARDFPLAFGQLKQTGRCTLHTRESELQAAYPGTFGYRVRAVTVAAHDADGPPPRGMLRNQGASTVSREDGSAPKRLSRFADALPLSEFRLYQDLWVYGLPGETLLQFEGSGFDTDWDLVLPATANPKGLRSLTDVLLTFDMNATYSATLAAQQALQPPTPVKRSIALAASMWDPQGLASLRASSGPVRLRFDLAKLALPRAEGTRILSNLVLLALGTTTQVYNATLQAEAAGTSATFPVSQGLAMSNAGPLQGTAAAHPLNAMAGVALDQPFVLQIDRAGVEAELRGLHDVVLWVEYEAVLA